MGLAGLTLTLLSAGSNGSTPERAYYVPLELHELIAKADLCFAGEIIRVDGGTVEVEVEERGFGDFSADTVRVQRFRDWICAKRWAPYAVGQRCLYFLEVSASDNRILGAGCEGESPLLMMNLVRTGAVDADEAFSRGSVDLQVLFEECRRYRAAFRQPPPRRGSGWVEARQTTDKLREYASSSPLAEHLALSTFDGWWRDPDAPTPHPTAARLDLGLGPMPTAVTCLSDGESGTQLVCTLPGALAWLELDAEGTVRARRDLYGEGWGFGSSLAPLGDLAGDGTRALSVGETDGAEARDGAVRILSFDAAGTLVRKMLFTLSEPAFGELRYRLDGFGYGLAALGDLDSDGTFELAVSAGAREGWIWIVSLDGAGEVVRARLVLDRGEAVRGPLALAAIGDVDHNGVADLAAAPGGWGDAKGSEVQLFFLARDGSVLGRRALLADERRGRVFGCALAAPGDWNGDGTPDLVVGGRDDPLRVLCLAADGGLAAELVLPLPAGLKRGAHFGSALAVQRRGARVRLLSAGYSSWEVKRGTGRALRSYPSLWSYDP